jgi:hypothetical protein
MLQGPAHCFRRAANVFKNDAGNQSLLCVSATSEDPALCAAAGKTLMLEVRKADSMAGVVVV